MNASGNNNALRTLTLILALLLIGLGVYTFKFYTAVQDNEIALTEEKTNLEEELNDILSKYNDELKTSKVLTAELQLARSRISKLLEQLQNSENTRTVLQNYRREIRQLRQEREFLLKKVDSLTLANEILTEQKIDVENAFSITVAERDSLQLQNTELQGDLMRGAQLTISNVLPAGIILRKSGKRIINSRADRIDKLEVCYTVNQNPLAETGIHNFYVQIIDPRNNVIGDRVTLQFDEYSLTYSARQELEYIHEESNACLLISSYAGEFTEGLYRINIFEDDVLLSSTELELE